MTANTLLAVVLPLLTAGIAHHLLIIPYNLFSWFNYPIDANLYLKNNPLFGENKSWRGLLFITITTGVLSLILSTYFMPPTTISPLFFGLLIGAGYSLAELPNSFLKRRRQIAPGTTEKSMVNSVWKIADQLDSPLGVAIVLIFTSTLSYSEILILMILGTAIHFLVDQYLQHYGYKKTRDQAK